MDLQLAGKTAVVTGSTAGIGLAIASLLAHEGATGIVNGRTQERVDEAIKEIAVSGNTRGVAGDLATARGVEERLGGRRVRSEIYVRSPTRAEFRSWQTQRYD